MINSESKVSKVNVERFSQRLENEVPLKRAKNSIGKSNIYRVQPTKLELYQTRAKLLQTKIANPPMDSNSFEQKLWVEQLAECNKKIAQLSK